MIPETSRSGSEEELPTPKEHLRERQHIQSMADKQMVINKVKKLYSEGYAIDEITRLTGHTYQAVIKYLKEDCFTGNNHYDRRLPGKLAPYEQEVIKMRSLGITYQKIHEHICGKGYSGTVASLQVFMQKERTHQKSISSAVQTENVDYIPQRCLCHCIVFSQKEIELDSWMATTTALQIEELDTYINGLKADIEAV